MAEMINPRHPAPEFDGPGPLLRTSLRLSLFFSDSFQSYNLQLYVSSWMSTSPLKGKLSVLFFTKVQNSNINERMKITEWTKYQTIVNITLHFGC